MRRAKRPADRVIEHLQETLRYDPETGEFWRRAGSVHTLGYVCLGGHLKNGGEREAYQVKAHRVAYFLMTGEWPPDDVCIDHINGDRRDNRWVNLRPCSFKENGWNRRGCGEIKVRGVTKTRGKTPRFKAQIGTHPNVVVLGYFDTVEQASAAYQEAAKKLYGEFAPIG
jgi:hypothetical protein